MAAKILLVEDDNNLREIYEARLQAEGYIIATAKDGEEALVVAKSEKPDLVISDVMMPRISGFEMLDILRNTDDLKDTKVIMLTALGQADDKTRANSLGADRYLVKSQVTLEDIVKAAHELIGDGTNAPAAAAATPAAPMMPPTPAAPAMPAPAMAPAAPFTPTPRPAPTMPTAAPAPTFSTMMGAQPAVPDPARPVSNEPAFATPAAQPAPMVTSPAMPADPAPAATVPPAPVTPAPAPTYTPVPQPPTPPEAPEPVAPAVLAPAEPTGAAIDSPTTAEEKATIDSQINAFAQSAAAPAMAVDGSEASKATQDDAVLATAMNDLAASADKPEAEAPAPAPEPAPTPEPVVAPTESAQQNQTDTTHGSVPIANKKIISPINSEPKQSIHDLLAKEEAKDTMAAGFNQAAAVVSPEPGNAPAAPGMPPAAPAPQAGNVFGPTNPAVPQPPAKPNDSFDPNNIAL